MLKPLTVWITTVENSKGDEITTPPYMPPEKPVCRTRSNRTRHGTMDWFKIKKGVCQDCILSPAYLTYMQTTSREIPGWMNHKLESRFPGEISTTSDMQVIPTLMLSLRM